MVHKIQIVTNQSKKEIKEHGSYQFPVLVSEETLSRYKSGSFLWHWHPEIEFTFVCSGSMIYQINQETFCLSEGDALFGNSNTLHTAHMNHGQDCHYISITFDPKLLCGYEGSILQTKYILPLIQNKNLSSIHFNSSKEWHTDIITMLQQICKIDHDSDDFLELDIQILLYQILRIILKQEHATLKELNAKDEHNLIRIKEIILYLQENYASKLELEDISKHVHICKSECCRLFKRYMKVTLFEYLLEYRIESSLAYIVNSNYTVTEAALYAGFADPNYYAKVFRKLKGCSPSSYRLQYLNSFNT